MDRTVRGRESIRNLQGSFLAKIQNQLQMNGLSMGEKE